MKRSTLGLLTLTFAAVLMPHVHAVPITLSGLPAYQWYHGCAPTAAASILGYWDLHGYPDMFDAGGEDIFLTGNVKDQISSPEHNARYDSKPDDLTQPRTWTSIADFMRTSAGNLSMGGTFSFMIRPGIEQYAASRNYLFDAWSRYDDDLQSVWENLVAEIDAGRPLMFLVDVVPDGAEDHAVPVLGYDIRGADDLWYAAYTTWTEDESIEWFQFRPPGLSYAWGVGEAIVIHPVSAPVPEPSTLALLGAGIACLGAAFGAQKFRNITLHNRQKD